MFKEIFFRLKSETPIFFKKMRILSIYIGGLLGAISFWLLKVHPNSTYGVSLASISSFCIIVLPVLFTLPNKDQLTDEERDNLINNKHENNNTQP